MNVQPFLEHVKYDDKDLVTAVVQDAETDQVLMVAYMNQDTLRQTLETNVMTYWSRSRQKVWVKGESSGNTQHVQEVRIDCDGDAIVFKVSQKGAACHTGFYSCFYRVFEDGQLVEQGERTFDPKKVYG